MWTGPADIDHAELPADRPGQVLIGLSLKQQCIPEELVTRAVG